MIKESLTNPGITRTPDLRSAGRAMCLCLAVVVLHGCRNEGEAGPKASTAAWSGLYRPSMKNLPRAAWRVSCSRACADSPWS